MNNTKPKKCEDTDGNLRMRIIELQNRIENGYGLTGKPIPQRRLKEMRKTLFRLEYELAERQGKRYMETGDLNEFSR